jgi:hypothetical protein
MMAMYVLGDMMMVLLASELQQCKGMTEKGNGQGAIDGYDFKTRSLRIYFPSAPKCILCVENALCSVHLCKEMTVFICWREGTGLYFGTRLVIFYKNHIESSYFR